MGQTFVACMCRELNRWIGALVFPDETCTQFIGGLPVACGQVMGLGEGPLNGLGRLFRGKGCGEGQPAYDDNDWIYPCGGAALPPETSYCLGPPPCAYVAAIMGNIGHPCTIDCFGGPY